MQTFFADIFSLYRSLLEPFRAPIFGPTLATYLLALALVVLLTFLCFAIPQALRLRAALSKIKGRPENVSEHDVSGHEKRATFQSNFAEIDHTLLDNKAISSVWKEFRKTLVLRGEKSESVVWGTARPNNFFNPRSLLVQYDFVRSLPNLFVGLGLLGTFIGLIAVLTFSTESLTAAANQDQIKKALSELLTTAAAKFYISAAGLVASIALTLLIRLTLKYLHGLVHELNDLLQARLLFTSEQDITQKQLSVQQDSLTELRLFNTNIAMKIGDAVRSAVEASNDTLTIKLSEIADSFARLVQSSGEGASRAVGDAMKGAFDASLRQASEAISGIAEQLRGLPDQLSQAATSIQEAGNAATLQQERLSESLKDAAKSIIHEAGTQIANNLNTGTQDVVRGLQATGATFGDSAEKIAGFFERFAGSGEDYIQTLSSLSEQNTKLESGLSAISSRISEAADRVTSAGTAVDSNLLKLLSSISEVSRLAAETNRVAQESQTAIRQTVDTLQKQMSLHMDRFNNVDDKLANVFNIISSHLELQSKQMGDQLATMDQALAGAVNQFEQLIDDLTVAVSTRRPAGVT
jgi:methyl-accepting chemotaxis protein